jgi:hypothetical protein
MTASTLLLWLGVRPDILVLAMADLASTQLEDLLQVSEVLARLPLQPNDALKLVDNQISIDTIRKVWANPRIPKTPFSEYPVGLHGFMQDTYPSRKWESVPFVLLDDFFYAIADGQKADPRRSPLFWGAEISWKRFLVSGFTVHPKDEEVFV